jgi:membrane-associated phospholipid phosphatase
MAQGPRRAPAEDVPELHLGREIVLSGIGSGLLLAGYLMPVDRLVVPPAGLDPGGIAWRADRGVVGRSSSSADRASNWTRNASLLFPFVLALAVAPQGARWEGLTKRGVVYAETLLVSQGATFLGKSLWDRARPYAYLAEADRPTEPSFDVGTERTFRSMPSGHASSAWTGATMVLTEFLLSRPQAPAWERFALGFVGGGLAVSTSSMRVVAGEHFPSDVLAVAGIGVATGVAVPLLHRGDRPLPSTGAWLETIGGVLAGTLAGVWVTR